MSPEWYAEQARLDRAQRRGEMAGVFLAICLAVNVTVALAYHLI